MLEVEGRYICVWRRKLGKNKKGKKIFYCVDNIILRSRKGKIKVGMLGVL